MGTTTLHWCQIPNFYNCIAMKLHLWFDCKSFYVCKMLRLIARFWALIYVHNVPLLYKRMFLLVDTAQFQLLKCNYFGYCSAKPLNNIKTFYLVFGKCFQLVGMLT